MAELTAFSTAAASAMSELMRRLAALRSTSSSASRSDSRTSTSGWAGMSTSSRRREEDWVMNGVSQMEPTRMVRERTAAWAVATAVRPGTIPVLGARVVPARSCPCPDRIGTSLGGSLPTGRQAARSAPSKGHKDKGAPVSRCPFSVSASARRTCLEIPAPGRCPLRACLSPRCPPAFTAPGCLHESRHCRTRPEAKHEGFPRRVFRLRRRRANGS